MAALAPTSNAQATTQNHATSVGQTVVNQAQVQTMIDTALAGIQAQLSRIELSFQGFGDRISLLEGRLQTVGAMVDANMTQVQKSLSLLDRGR